jgi:hypothetical protein
MTKDEQLAAERYPSPNPEELPEALDEYSTVLFERHAFIAGRKSMREEDEWISVQDYLPDKEERVLCFWPKHFISQFQKFNTTIEVLLDKEGFIRGGITHWKPLPKPPKKTITLWQKY